MPMRFLIQTPVSTGAQLSLDAERSHYLCKVMRMKSGDVVKCFDGRGTSFEAELNQANPKKSLLQVIHMEAAVDMAPHGLHLGLSMLKGQAMDRALHQATELGASEISLINAKRSNVALDARRTDNKMTHWQKIVAAACEQSGRLFVPALHRPNGLDTLLAGAPEKPMVFDAAGAPLPGALPAESRLILIGPEGGWDDAERTEFTRLGIECYSLGEHILRAETMPAVALALLHHLQFS